MTVRALAFAAFVLAVAAGAPGRASAQTLAQGEHAWSEADFARAGTIFDAVLAAPSSDRAAILSAHRHLAAIASMRHDDASARTHAAAAVALQHDVTPPDGAPAAAAALFDAARAASPAPAALDVTSDPAEAGQPVAVRASLTHAPDGLVARLHLLCRGESALRAEESGAPPSVSLTLPRPEDTPSCEAEALTAGGAAVLRATLALSVAGATGGGEHGAPAAAPSHGDDTLVWVLGIGAGVLVVAAAVVVVVLLATNVQSEPSIGGVEIRGW